MHLVKKVNAMSGIRKLHRMFLDDRRQLMDVSNPKTGIPSQYFQVCALFTPLLENARRANLMELYEMASAGKYVKNQDFLKLEQMAKKIDYEKVCNQGLYNR